MLFNEETALGNVWYCNTTSHKIQPNITDCDCILGKSYSCQALMGYIKWNGGLEDIWALDDVSHICYQWPMRVIWNSWAIAVSVWCYYYRERDWLQTTVFVWGNDEQLNWTTSSKANLDHSASSSVKCRLFQACMGNSCAHVRKMILANSSEVCRLQKRLFMCGCSDDHWDGAHSLG